MTDKPSDRAYAQAFREWANDGSQEWRDNHPAENWVPDRAREIDAAAPDGAQAVASVCLVTHRNLPHFAAAEIQLFDGYEPKIGDKLYTAPPSQDADQPTGFYLASFKRPRLGAPILWWMPDNAGYTPDLMQAGIYTDLKIGYHQSEYTVPVPTWFMGGCRIRHEIDPGDSENTAFWSAEKLRTAIVGATAARAESNPNNKASPNG